ncbi:hypothetical protein DUNSADRAFT_13485 [Dunaliella salina]|uniref:Uncharacterized protein n=1 Tax=Dunaliella salina TaxID=3046 RepID=A0ABQ7G987_DUNSA|nr:hypothetical protein DUNSADRAFT_13485 [Dunaliella salina]|eukprot:KAF5831182.1 hypothetical protein DUNSADRAFT_13485 [Dunaliella salina]
MSVIQHGINSKICDGCDVSLTMNNMHVSLNCNPSPFQLGSQQLVKGTAQRPSFSKAKSPEGWKCQPLLQPKSNFTTRTSLALSPLPWASSSASSRRLHTAALPGSMNVEEVAEAAEAADLAQHPNFGLGLYGIPGLTRPEGFFQLCEEAEAACAQLLQRIVALDVLGARSRGGTQDAKEDLEAKLDELVAAYEFVVAGCKLPASHCREHHEGPEWRLAARLAEDEQLQPLSQGLYHVLHRHSLWGHLLQRRLNNFNSSSSSSSSSNSTATQPQERQQGTDVLEQQQQQQQQLEPLEQGLGGEAIVQQQQRDQHPRTELQQVWQLQQLLCATK